MAAPRAFLFRWLPALAWLLLLACLPWWLDLPLLLALATAMLLREQRLLAHAGLIRRALRWGLPGLLLALFRAWGTDALALIGTLLAALAGFSLLMLLESWLDRSRSRPDQIRLDRGRRREPSPSSSAEWPELALAPIGPPAQIIELQWPQWRPANGEWPDPRGGVAQCHDGACRFADGVSIERIGAQVGFSPGGRWFASRDRRQLLLCDRDRQRLHRLRGWQLCGWHDEQPWLQRREGEPPLALNHVLGHDDMHD